MGKKSFKKMRLFEKKEIKTSSKKASLWDDDFDFEDSEDASEWIKCYKGQSSSLDDVEPISEYLKAADEGKKKRKKYRSLLNDDYYSEESYFESESSLHSCNNEPQCLIVEGVATPVSSDQDADVGDDEVSDRALRIAEDFARRESLAIFGKALCFYNGRFYTLLHEDEAKRKIFSVYRNEIGQARAASVLNNAASLLKYCVSNTYEEFPVKADIIVFENGTLEIHTGHFRPNKAEDLASSALGICYQPNSRKMPCTKRFLEMIADGDEDLYERMLQVIGYILSNDIKAKSFFYLEGVGDAGKSRFCDLIASFFPIYGSNKVARIALQDLGGKFALGNLVNAKLNISEDLPDSPLSPTTVSRIKMISDANRLEAEAKYVQPFSFRPMCKLLFASNHPLRLKEYDAAFVNRVVYLPFLHPIPKHKQDKNILEKMQTELPALFNHAFEAYQRLVANGYVWAGSERFQPDILTANSGLSIDKSAILKQFVESCCVFEKEAVTATSELQSAYQHFCDEHTYIPIKGDRFSREFFAVLPEEVVRVKIGNKQRGFKGIRLNNF